MGFRFRKSVKLPLGVKLNISKNGVGVSAGVKGIRKSTSPTAQVRTTYSIPGTGLSYTKSSGNIKKGSEAMTDILYGLSIGGGLYYVRTNSNDEAIWEHTALPHVWKTYSGAEKAKVRIASQSGAHKGKTIEIVSFRHKEQ